VVQLAVFPVGAVVYVSINAVGYAGLVVPILLLLAVGSFRFWQRTLANAGEMVAARKEDLVATLYRAV
jgi:hypothetical protein